MSEPGRKTSFSHVNAMVLPVATNIRAAAEQFGQVTLENVDWSVAASLPDTVKSAVASALKLDFYIDANEERDILQQTQKEDRNYVSSLLKLFEQEPLVLTRARRVQQLMENRSCSYFSPDKDCASVSQKQDLRKEFERGLRWGLVQITHHPNPAVAEEARHLLYKLDDRPILKASNK